MRKIIFLSFLLIASVTAFSQQIKTSPVLTKQDYLKKSKTQKTIAWILAGTGVGFVTAAIATASVNDVVNAIVGDDSGLNTSAIFLVIGGITTVSSVPLFIASGRNKKKGMSLSFKNEIAPQLRENSFVNRYIPSFSLKINL
jgi:ABC-type enterochelin transport system permease subunit